MGERKPGLLPFTPVSNGFGYLLPTHGRSEARSSRGGMCFL